MTDGAVRARLVNTEGELLAEGPCWLDESNRHATLEPERITNASRKERGEALTLEMESGRTIRVSDRLMVVRIARPGGGTNGHGNSHGDGRRSLYRLRIMEDAFPQGTTSTNEAQDAKAAGAAEEGTPALRAIGGLRYDGETSAAR